MVGVWVAGVASARDAHVWGACMRFLLAGVLTDKVMLHDGSFLVLIYSAGEVRLSYVFSRPVFES